MEIKYYKHQKWLIENAKNWVLLPWNTGTGKSYGILGLYFKHKKEIKNGILISIKADKQKWVELLAKHDIKNIDVYTKEEWKKIATKKIKKTVFNPQKQATETITKTIPAPEQVKKYDLVIFDECFTGDAIIETKQGNKKIKDVNVGDIVKNAIGYGVVVAKSKRMYYDDLYIINTKNGKIRATKNHLFFTINGWIKAKNLKKNDILLTGHYANGIMRLYNKFNFKKYVEMFILRENQPLRISRKKKKILLSQLCREIYVEKKQDKSITGIIKRVYGRKRGKKKKKSIIKNEKKQSNEKRNNTKKSFRNIKKNWSQTNSSRWKRKTNAESTKKIIKKIRAWMESRISCINNYNKKQKKTKTSHKLQNRYSTSNKKNSDRNRWKLSQFFYKKRTRQEKNKNINYVRVESISIQKQTNRREYYKGVEVYNLEVSGHPTYTVNSVLVHNCHFALGLKSMLHKSFYRYLKLNKPKFLWLATATPYPNNPWNLYALGKLFGQEWNYKKFQRHFYSMVPMGARLIPKVKTFINGSPLQDEIAKYIRLFGKPVKIEECVDMPKMILKEEYFEMTREQKEYYNSVREDLILTRNLKWHQICGGTLKTEEGTITMKTKKLDRVVELCEVNPKIFIVCNYQAEVDMLYEKLSKKFKDRKVLTFTGKNSSDRKRRADLTDELDSCIVIANASCSTAYETRTIPLMVFYSYNYSLTNYIQMVGRIRRINKPEPRTYISLIIKDSIDEAVFKAIQKKKSFDFKIYNRKM